MEFHFYHYKGTLEVLSKSGQGSGSGLYGLNKIGTLPVFFLPHCVNLPLLPDETALSFDKTLEKIIPAEKHVKKMVTFCFILIKNKILFNHHEVKSAF